MLKRKITKRRNNRKRKNTQRLRRKSRKYVGGLRDIHADLPPPSITFCPGCKGFQTLKLESAEPISIDNMPTFTCKCDFKVDNYIVHHLIDVCKATKYTNKKNFDQYKRDAELAVDRFNIVSEKPPITIDDLKVIVTSEDNQKKYRDYLINIRKIAIGYGMDVDRIDGPESQSVYTNYTKTEKLLRWLPLKNSQFYNESAANVFKGVIS